MPNNNKTFHLEYAHFLEYICEKLKGNHHIEKNKGLYFLITK